MEHDVGEKPEVVAIAQRLAMDRFAVVGRLHKVWCWFDQQTRNGNAPGLTPAFLDSLVAHEGFAAEMVAVGWLSTRNGHVSVPKFDRHNSKSAKERALAAARKSRSRHAPSVNKPAPVLSISNSNSYSDSFFLIFWDSFPKGRRKSKGEALRAWKKALGKATADELIEAAREYAESDEGQGQFVKMPSTWLNKECWNDDREAWREKTDTDPRGNLALRQRLMEVEDGEIIDEA